MTPTHSSPSSPDGPPDCPPRRLPIGEFIALVAMNFAMVAFSIDAMLPALPEMAAVLTPQAPNRAQLVLSSFVFGMGLGTLFAGPLSDTFGRKKTIFAAGILYLLGAAAGAMANSLETMLLARVVQGLGVAGPRVVVLAVVRDLYEGRQMARIMSYAMMIFTFVPALAPLIGSFIIAAAGWRAVFIAFMLFACISIGWLLIRQPETLPPRKRRALDLRSLARATGECLSHRSFVVATILNALAFGMLVSNLSSIQQIFEVTYQRADSFPLWFAMMALLSGFSAIVNAKLVTRHGMRKMAAIGFATQICIATGALILTLLTQQLPFAYFVLWAASVFFMAGLVLGNLTALAMEPLGHIAGMAASLIGSLGTMGGVLIAIPVGLSFDGTPTPLALSLVFLSVLGFWIIKRWLP